MGKEEAMAEKRAYRGSMTVFFSVLTVLFLALISAMAESVRVQGPEQRLLPCWIWGFSLYLENMREIFWRSTRSSEWTHLMGAKIFRRKKLSGEADFFMKYNIEPTRGTMLTGNTLFPVRTEGSSILRTLLLTDEDAGSSGTRLCRI